MNLTEKSQLPAGTLEFEGRTYLDGRASDPRTLGWMQGSPPPANKRITLESDRSQEFPEARWSLSHIRELLPTVNVTRGPGAPSPLDRDDMSAEIDALTFEDVSGRIHRFDESLFDTYTDGIMVLHRGRVVYERYFGALTPELQHHAHSAGKSYVGTLAASLVHEGVLDDSKLIPHYVPELGGSAWEDATLRQVMDMRTGLETRTDYVDKGSDSWDYMRASGIAPRPAGYNGPKSVCEYLPTIRKKGQHGEAFAYHCVNTEVLAWVMARVAGPLAQLLHERLWAPLGCEDDAYLTIDQAGMPTASGALCATLRDFARFGELMRREGEWNGKELIPAAVVADVQRGGDRARFAYPGPMMQGYSYRSQWWVSHNELDVFEARGYQGQKLSIAPKAEMVVARFASHPVGLSRGGDAITMPQLLALGQMLRG